MTELCYHEATAPVELGHAGSGEVVARLCLACGEQLHPGFGCRDCEWTEETLSSLAGPIRVLFVLRRPCPRHRDAV